jgi:hypothetical protein
MYVWFAVWAMCGLSGFVITVSPARQIHPSAFRPFLKLGCTIYSGFVTIVPKWPNYDSRGRRNPAQVRCTLPSAAVVFVYAFTDRDWLARRSGLSVS